MPRHRLSRAVIGLMFAAATLAPLPAPAEDTAPCPERPPRLPAAQRPATPEAGSQETQIYARELQSNRDGTSEFIGDVELQRDGQSLAADVVRYDEAGRQLDATGNVVFKEPTGLNYRTQEAHINLETRIGHAGGGEFSLDDGSARGDAGRIDFEGPEITRLTDVRYTTCAPGQDDWFLKTGELELDTGQDIGVARRASITFHGAPLIYLPYLSFSISDERKSGFLIPRVGYESQRGMEISTPYYFNLAPEFDDTLTPKLMTRRGLQWQNEFRYLTPRSQGELDFEILPNDRLANGDSRAAGTYLHRHFFNPLWSANVDLRGISDKEYFDDFDDDIGVTSQTHLPQNARLEYLGPRWNFTARLADYQTIDRTIPVSERPYARLPQFSLSLSRPAVPNRIHYALESELVSFERDASQNGGRLSLYPSVSLPLSNRYGFLTPRIGLQHIAYSLSGIAESTPTLTRGIFSLDSGLIFERDSLWGGRRFTQTLEPRLYYLYIPEKNQDALPNFDTGLPEFTFDNLFRDNRFVGGDRIGDANQITAAVTTRFIDEQDGVQRGSASLGRIYYFDDRQVNLPASTASTHASDVVAEFSVMPVRQWVVRASGQWDPRENTTQRYSYYFQYNPAKDRIVNIGRRFSRGELEQVDVSTQWPLATRWTLRARSLRSEAENRNLESYVGVEYNACCWALRVVGRRRLVVDPVDSSTEQRFSVMFELELTGLSRLGHVPDSPLKESMFYPAPP